MFKKKICSIPFTRCSFTYILVGSPFPWSVIGHLPQTVQNLARIAKKHDTIYLELRLQNTLRISFHEATPYNLVENDKIVRLRNSCQEVRRCHRLTRIYICIDYYELLRYVQPLHPLLQSPYYPHSVHALHKHFVSPLAVVSIHPPNRMVLWHRYRNRSISQYKLSKSSTV